MPATERGSVSAAYPGNRRAVSTICHPARSAQIFCERHNNSLSPLDAHAAHAFKVMDDFYIDQIGKNDLGGNHIDVVHGEHLERWLLKMIWGATAAFPTVPPIRSDIDRTMLAQYLFRDGPLPTDWGLYTKGLQHGRKSNPEQTLTVGLENIDGELWGGSVVVGGWNSISASEASPVTAARPSPTGPVRCSSTAPAPPTARS